jgi:hypothetical protein
MTNALRHLTYANVMATVAVFVALGGSSYAALTITGRDVRNESLTGKDVKGLTGRDVRNESLTGKDVKGLTGADIANGRLRAEDFASGQLPQGPQGPQGAPGPPGRDGAAADITTVVRTDGPCPTPPAGGFCLVRAMCQPGERATGGGAGLDGVSGAEILRISRPVEANQTMAEAGEVAVGWEAVIENDGPGPDNATGYVICVSP